MLVVIVETVIADDELLIIVSDIVEARIFTTLVDVSELVAVVGLAIEIVVADVVVILPVIDVVGTKIAKVRYFR
jgi:hypothetical protein